MTLGQLNALFRYELYYNHIQLLKGILLDALMSIFKALSRHSSAATEKIHQNCSQGNSVPSEILNQR